MQLAFEESDHGYEQQTEGKRRELTYPYRVCKVLRRPCTGRHHRVLREGCGSQVEWRNGMWMRVSAPTRRADDGVLHLVLDAGRSIGDDVDAAAEPRQTHNIVGGGVRLTAV
jgi:hypothetical protein